MAVSDLLDAVSGLVRHHRPAIDAMVKRRGERLELASVLSVAEHYRANGWTVSVRNPSVAPATFAVKVRATGDAYAYSHLNVARGSHTLEIRMNQSVVGAHDPGIYCVDVAVLAPGRVPVKKKGSPQALPNRFLISFAEAKALPIYPMLLAQFIGIVHELKPTLLLRPRLVASLAFGATGHPPPTLVVLGRYSGNSATIVRAYPSRGVLVHVAEEFDARLFRYATRGTVSPLFS